MKKTLLIVTLFVFALACKQAVKGDNGVTYKTAVQYNDYIVSRQTDLMKKIMAFGEVAQTNLDSAKKMLDLYETQTEQMIREIKGMPPFKGDSTMRNAAIESFSFYKKVFSTDYRNLIAIRENGGDQTENGVAEMNDIVQKITREEEKFDKSFHNAQRSFAEKNKMKLIDNEMQKKINDMNND